MWRGGYVEDRSNSPVTLLDKLGPIGNRTGQHPAVDEVEVLSIGPVLLDVVDEERDVRRNAIGKKGK